MMWVREGYTVRQLSHISGHSEAKVKRIKNYWMRQDPPALPEDIYSRAKYLIFDGTYFHKNGCLVLLIDHQTKNILFSAYIDKESYESIYPLLLGLREKGLNPHTVTMDGHRFVIRAIQEVWPTVRIQRCLYHIQRQGLAWIRRYPKTEAGKALRTILKSVTEIATDKDREKFISIYRAWHEDWGPFIRSLPWTSVANKDLKRVMGLINNAIPDMFHYLRDRKIPPTTNLLENFYSQLKHHYRNHRGLTEEHKVSYLKWFCYYKYHEKNNN